MRHRQRWLVGVVLVGLVLLALSAVVDSPVTDAAPNLYAGLVVLVVAARLVKAFGPERVISTVSAVALGVGGLVAIYEGLCALIRTTPLPDIVLTGDIALLIGLGLFVYDLRFVR